ncbi:MAG: hypothetical protein JWO40_242 [Candidatus Doudnabacteria bacterium]|nr:hypothetical protein [Candidatus Doudnabacteria bacterium]
MMSSQLSAYPRKQPRHQRSFTFSHGRNDFPLGNQVPRLYSRHARELIHDRAATISTVEHSVIVADADHPIQRACGVAIENLHRATNVSLELFSKTSEARINGVVRYFSYETEHHHRQGSRKENKYFLHPNLLSE